MIAYVLISAQIFITIVFQTYFHRGEFMPMQADEIKNLILETFLTLKLRLMILEVMVTIMQLTLKQAHLKVFQKLNNTKWFTRLLKVRWGMIFTL